MSTSLRIIKNSVFLTASQIFAKIINFGLILVLTRYLTKDGFGLYSFSIAYASMFFFLTNLGIVNLLVRDIAQNKERASEYVGKTLPMVLVFSAFFLIVVNILPTVLHWNSTERLVTAGFSLYFLFDGFSRYSLAVMRAFEQMGYEAVLFTIERLLLMITSLGCWYLDASLISLVLIFVLIMGIKSFISFAILRKKFISITFTWSIAGIAPILKESYPFALMTLFTTGISRIDLLIINGFHTPEAVAIYNTAHKIIEALSFIPENIYGAVFPALSLFYVTQKDKFDYTFKQTFIAITVLAIPISACFFVLSPKIISLLFESDYYEAYIPLRWLSLALLIFFVRQSFSLALNTTEKQHIFAIILGIGMVINIIANLILVPKFSLLGASLALIISECIIIICLLPFVLQKVNLQWSKTLVPRLILCGLILTVLIYGIREIHFAFILAIIGIVYPALLHILRIITFAEIKIYSLILLGKRAN